MTAWKYPDYIMDPDRRKTYAPGSEGKPKGTKEELPDAPPKRRKAKKATPAAAPDAPEDPGKAPGS